MIIVTTIDSRPKVDIARREGLKLGPNRQMQLLMLEPFCTDTATDAGLCRYRTILCYAMLCYAMLCYAIMYYTALHYTTLHFTILHYTIL